MKIALLGASGFVGTEIIGQGLEQQCEIKVLVRSLEKMRDLQAKVDIVQGDYFNRESLSEAVEGVDAILSTIGPPETRKSDLTPEHFKAAMKNLVEVMREFKIHRFIYLASTGTSYQGESLSIGRKLLRAALSIIAPLVIPSKEAELQVLRESNIAWTSIRPPLIKSGVKGDFHVDLFKTQGLKVDVKQLAAFMLDNVTDTSWVKKAPFVGTK